MLLKIMPDFKLKKLIAVYRSEESYYMEQMDVIADKTSKPMPVTREFLEGLLTDVKIKDNRNLTYSICNTEPKGKRILALEVRPDGFSVCWISREASRTIYLTEALAKSVGIATQALIMEFPPIIFKYHHGIHMRCVMDFNIGPLNMTYEMPLPNMTNSGSLCLGTAELEISPNLDKFMFDLERSVFNAKFSHFSGVVPKTEEHPLMYLFHRDQGTISCTELNERGNVKEFISFAHR